MIWFIQCSLLCSSSSTAVYHKYKSKGDLSTKPSHINFVHHLVWFFFLSMASESIRKWVIWHNDFHVGTLYDALDFDYNIITLFTVCHVRNIYLLTQIWRWELVINDNSEPTRRESITKKKCLTESSATRRSWKKKLWKRSSRAAVDAIVQRFHLFGLVSAGASIMWKSKRHISFSLPKHMGIQETFLRLKPILFRKETMT